ncbi:response regulator [Nocardioides sp. J2M5]|uniref:response regulator n=1 Tax=Nocardioides palaemonis TaxID=2829810 RepID=UPI001BA52D5C|nr:response regulator [Nocardioides palaemonis]MBS2938360.1 response regulator [Nocardioides palaemonis]
MADVLLVDDDDDVREVVALRLRRSGHRVHSFGDPRQVLPFVATTPVDVVVLDWHMPHLSGGELCARLRMLPHLAEVPVVVATAFSDGDTREQALAAGVTAFLPKPFALTELDSLVTVLLRRGADDAAPDLPWARRPLLKVFVRPHDSCPRTACGDLECPERVSACAAPLARL